MTCFATVLDGGRGHIRVDMGGDCVMTAVDLGPEMRLWMHKGVSLDAAGAREFARLLTRFANKDKDGASVEPPADADSMYMDALFELTQ